MQKKKHGSFGGCLLFALLGAGLLTLAADAVTAAFLTPLTETIFFGLFGGLVLVLFILLRLSRKARVLIPLLSVLTLLLCAAAAFCWFRFSENAVYQTVDSGKQELYGGKNVMLIVPHQDDDLNVLGGVLEEFLRYGSEVRVVFATNGDFIDTSTGLERLREALTVADFYGLPQDHVIFLGYGDGYPDEFPHIYNSGDETVYSHAWNSKTYALEDHGPYTEGTAYTGSNIRRDFHDVILEYKPDMIFTCDYDDHTDHRAVSLLVDAALGDLLKEEPDYEPLVYHSLAYSLAYYNKEDFYARNMLSTVNPYSSDRMEERPDYLWDARVRLPVAAASLSRSLFTDTLYEAIKLYATQGAGERGLSIINGDKVFWQRDTASLLYNAEIAVSTGDGSKLNDFMIIDSDDLADTSHPPYDSVWCPTDFYAEILVKFPEPVSIENIVLYDSPDPESNVLNAALTFEDGTVIETGPLDIYGSATSVRVVKDNVSSFRVRLTETEGTAPGLAELEAFSGARGSVSASFIKLMNSDGDFAYDYYIHKSGKEAFRLYSYDCDVTLDSCSVVCDNDSCSAQIVDGLLLVTCPSGESCTVTVTDASGSLSDSVRFSNPSAWATLGQTVERVFRRFFPGIRSAVSYTLLHRLYYGF